MTTINGWLSISINNFAELPISLIRLLASFRRESADDSHANNTTRNTKESTTTSAFQCNCR